MRSVEFQVTPSHFKSSPTSFRLPIFLYLLSNEFMEIGFWELKWQFLYLQSLAMKNSLLSKINHLSIYQVPKDTKLETRLDVSKVIRVKMEMMSLDKGWVVGWVFMANVTNMCPWICCKSGQTTTLHLVTVRFSNYTGIYVYPLDSQVLHWLWRACSKFNQ